MPEPFVAPLTLLLLALFAGWAAVDGTSVGQFGVSRPLVAVLGAGSDPDGLAATVDGGHLQFPSEDRGRHRKLEPADQLGSLPGEALVGPDPDFDVEVPCPGAGVTGVGRSSGALPGRAVVLTRSQYDRRPLCHRERGQ